MERFWRYKLDHVIFWIATIVFHMFTRLYLINKAGFSEFLIEIVTRNALLAVIIYVNLLVLIPRFAQKKKWFLYVVLLLVDFSFYVSAKNIHDVYLYGHIIGDPTRSQFLSNSFYNLSIAIFYMAFSVALQLSHEWYAQRELIRRIEVEKLNTELDYLKAQINPHFLFNSINTIYFQIDKHNTTARETLSSFSEMLRYQLYECNGKEIPVEKEVAYLKSYVDLQRYRKDENYEISFSCSGLEGFTIAPLLLIPFVENAFKHVSHKPSGNEIKIALARKGEIFSVTIANTKDTPRRVNGEGQGIGLKNVMRRLELLYKDRHSLSVHDKDDRFEVTLELRLN
jgi:two-component system, LytTR family, sensor kinase